MNDLTAIKAKEFSKEMYYFKENKECRKRKKTLRNSSSSSQSRLRCMGRTGFMKFVLGIFYKHWKVRFTSRVDYAEAKTPPLKTKAGLLLIGAVT